MYDSREVSARQPRANIKVAGVGGAGCNAVARMSAAGESTVEYMAINTDAQSLMGCESVIRIPIGAQATRGLGAGADPRMGRAAVEEKRDEIRARLEGADMVFVTVGMGGGTGTGASPVVAEIARELGALTVGVVTRPFSFEGMRRRRMAEEGVQQIAGCVDALITVSNDRLVAEAGGRIGMVEAFQLADEVLCAAVRGVCDIIDVHGQINLDFADVRTILRGSGPALIGIGRGRGDTRAADAARGAISSPLLENSIHGARGLLINITGGTNLSLHEVDEAARMIAGAADPDANIICGVVVNDRALQRSEEEIRIIVVAAGLKASKEEEDETATTTETALAWPANAPREAVSIPLPRGRETMGWRFGARRNSA